jgi:hypothetical protein
MKNRITWRIGRPYFYHPWHDGLPTFRDWLALLFGADLDVLSERNNQHGHA